MPSEPSLVLPFSAATAVHATSSHTYSATFHDDWCIGSVPHGGYVTSTFQRVAALHFSTTLSAQRQPHLLSLHLEFVRRTSAGPATFTVRDVKLGRQTSTLHISLTQGDREEVLGYLTHTDLASATGPSFKTQWSLTPPPHPIDARTLRSPAPLTDSTGHWALVPHLPFDGFRKASRRVDWLLPTRAMPPGLSDQWIRLAKTPGASGPAERFGADALGFVADMFPQLIETFLMPGVYAASDAPAAQGGRRKDARARFWYPTLLLNLEVKKAAPTDGWEWLFVRVLAKTIKDGRYDIDVTVCDEGGEVVALSQHVAFAVDASRNLSERSKGKGKL